MESDQRIVKRLDSRIDQLLIDLDKLRAISRPSLPNVPALTIAEVQQQLLAEDQVLPAFHLGEQKGYLWEIHKGRHNVHLLPARNEIVPLASRLHKLMKSPNHTDRVLREFHASRLSAMLLSQVKLENKQLLIINDEAIHFIPFAALPTNGETQILLGQDHDITHLNSVTHSLLLKEKLQNTPPYSKLAAIFADPVFNEEDDRFTNHHSLPGLLEDFPLPRLPRLPHSSDEARALAVFDHLGEIDVALGFDANRASLLKQGLSGYRVVHFGSHAEADPRFPELSGIWLSNLTEDGRLSSGFLHAYELHATKLNANLVVLSGCETALGINVRGEGVWSLAQSIQDAGGINVLVSLWRVQDEPTAFLMSRFYHHLLQDKRPPERALRMAQQETRAQERWQDPLYWAGFTLQGSWWKLGKN